MHYLKGDLQKKWSVYNQKCGGPKKIVIIEIIIVVIINVVIITIKDKER